MHLCCSGRELELYLQPSRHLGLPQSHARGKSGHGYRPVMPMTSQQWWADLIARVGLAFAFLYPPYAALTDPTSWLSYFSFFFRYIAAMAHIPTVLLLHR